MGVDSRVGAEQPQRELGPGHLEGEEPDRLAPTLGCVLGNVETERGLPHGGSAGDDYELALLQTAGHLVDVDKARRQSGDHVLRLGQLVDRPEALLDDLPHVDEAMANAALGNVEDRLLRLIEKGPPARPHPRSRTERCGFRRG